MVYNNELKAYAKMILNNVDEISTIIKEAEMIDKASMEYRHIIFNLKKLEKLAKEIQQY